MYTALCAYTNNKQAEAGGTRCKNAGTARGGGGGAEILVQHTHFKCLTGGLHMCCPTPSITTRARVSESNCMPVGYTL